MKFNKILFSLLIFLILPIGWTAEDGDKKWPKSSQADTDDLNGYCERKCKEIFPLKNVGMATCVKYCMNDAPAIYKKK